MDELEKHEALAAQLAAEDATIQQRGEGAAAALKRDIPASERHDIPAEDFAGEGESFPIEKPEDVAAAATRLNSTNQDKAKVRAAIIRIAHRKGDAFVAQLPETWKDAKKDVEPEFDGIKALTFGSEVKMSADGLVEGYLVLFGTPESADFDGDYFTKDTDFDVDWGEVNEATVKLLPVDARAGAEATWKLADDVYGDAEVLGVGGKSTVYFNHTLDPVIADHKLGGGTKGKLTLTDKGVWIQARLKEGDQYDEMVKELMKARATRGKTPGWSSGVPGHLVKKQTVTSTNGVTAHWVKKWSLGTDASITHTPNDWRNNAKLKTLADFSQALAAEQGQARGQTDAGEGDALSMSSTTSMENKSMDVKLVEAAMSAVIDGLGLKLSPEQRESAKAQAIAALKATNDCPPDDPDCSDDMTVKTVQSPEFVKQMADILKRIAAMENDAALASIKAQAAAFKPEPQSKAPAGLQSTPQDIQVYTKYHDLNARDMAYVAWFMKQNSFIHHTQYQPTQQFMRELADKTLKSYDKGELKHLPVADDENPNAVPRAIKMVRAIKSNELDYSTQAGYGDEWVPDLWSSELWMKDRLENVVYSRIRPVDMPSNPYELPVETTDPIVYKVPEATNQAQLTYTASVFTQSKMATAKSTITAYKIGLQTPFSAEMNEDSIIQFAPELRYQATWAMTNAIEYDILQADNTAAATGNINKDDSTVNSSDLDKWMLGFKGVAYLPLVTDTTRAINVNGSPTLQMLRSLRSKFQAARIGQLQNFIYVTDPVTALKLLNIDEVITLEKYGPNATVLTGEIAKIDNIPLLQTANLGLGDTTGKLSNTAGNNAYGRILLIYTPAYRVGYRRQIQMGVDYERGFDAYIMTATVRFGLVQRDTDASAIAYNIAV